MQSLAWVAACCQNRPIDALAPVSFKTYVKPIVTTSIPLKGLSVGQAGRTLEILEGIPASAKVDFQPANAYPLPKVTAVSSDGTVVAVDFSGDGFLSLLGLKAGSATITLSSGAVTATLAVVVSAVPAIIPPVYTPPARIPATAIALTENAKTVAPNIQFDIGALVEPYGFNSQTVLWSSSDSSIAVVADVSLIEHRTGINRLRYVATIRPIKIGTATITATIGALSASCTVTVN